MYLEFSLFKIFSTIKFEPFISRSQDSLECEYGARGEILTRKTGFPQNSLSNAHFYTSNYPIVSDE